MVRAVIEEMQARIDHGTFAAGRSLPSERYLAEQFEVSRLVIRQAIKELDNLGLISCKPNCRPVVKPRGPRLARRDQNGPRHLFIWLWPNTAYYSASCILKGIQSVAVPPDVRLVVGSASDSTGFEGCLASEDKFLRGVAADEHAAGLIIWYLGADQNRPALQEVRDAGIPMVFVDRRPPGPMDGDHVGIDNFAASQAAVRHLVGLGHGRIALVTNQDLASTVRERESGYRSALQEANIPFDYELVRHETVDEQEGIEPVLDGLLALETPPTAIIGINDQIALQVYEGLQSRGVVVPRHMSVLGFDGLLRWVTGGGYLTSCCQPFERIGQIAVELLLDRMSSGFSTAFRHVLLEAPLVTCGSTDTPLPTSTAKSFVYSENMK